VSVKKRFIRELMPLVSEAETAILAKDGEKSRRIAIALLKLVENYDGRLSRDEIRDALNNPAAVAIAKRLGLKP
jgi:DNA-binding transcriptional ArsR family regulator